MVYFDWLHGSTMTLIIFLPANQNGKRKCRNSKKRQTPPTDTPPNVLTTGTTVLPVVCACWTCNVPVRSKDWRSDEGATTFVRLTPRTLWALFRRVLSTRLRTRTFFFHRCLPIDIVLLTAAAAVALSFFHFESIVCIPPTINIYIYQNQYQK